MATASYKPQDYQGGTAQDMKERASEHADRISAQMDRVAQSASDQAQMVSDNMRTVASNIDSAVRRVDQLFDRLASRGAVKATFDEAHGTRRSKLVRMKVPGALVLIRRAMPAHTGPDSSVP